MRKANYFTTQELELYISQDGIFNESQMKIINRKTPESEIEIKKDESGFEYKSVKAAYVKALVNMVSGGNFSFEIKSREFIPSTREVLVEGRLTIFVNGKTIIREQFGQHYLHTKTEQNKEGNKTLTKASDIGNGYKAAASDCFKKCASELGFCWDIYRQERADNKKEEVPTPVHGDVKKLERLVFFLSQSKDVDTIENIYENWLYTSKETEESKAILKEHISRVLKLN